MLPTHPPRRVKRQLAILSEHLQNQHGSLVGDLTDQVIDQSPDARVKHLVALRACGCTARGFCQLVGRKKSLAASWSVIVTWLQMKCRLDLAGVVDRSASPQLTRQKNEKPMQVQRLFYHGGRGLTLTAFASLKPVPVARFAMQQFAPQSADGSKTACRCRR